MLAVITRSEGNHTMSPDAPVALITGSARRIGAAIVEELHDRGLRTLIHYRNSGAEAEALAARLNAKRPASAAILQADLNSMSETETLARDAVVQWGRMDLLVNNASSFYPTPLAEADEAAWEDLMASNLKAPFFLVRHLAPALREQGGGIVNIVDIYAERPMPAHPIYTAAKAGLVALTKALARDLAPAIRVNAVAPGAILWPDDMADTTPEEDQRYLQRVPLKRKGEPGDIARAVAFRACEAPYVTGQILQIDGGRSLNM